MNDSVASGSRRYALVAYDFSERVAGGSVRAIGFARDSPRFGWNASVITASPEVETPEIDGVRVISAPSRDQRFSGGIRDSDGDGLLRPAGGLLRILAPVKRLLPLERQLAWLPGFKRVARSMSFDDVSIVLTTVAPYASIVPGKWLAARLGVPHVIDLRDDWNDRIRIEKRSWSNRIILDRLMLRWLKEAAAVLVVSPITRDRLQALGINAHLVYNGFNEDDFADVPLEATAVNPDGPLTCLHTGWLGSFRSALPLLEAMERVSRNKETSAAFRFSQMGLVDAHSMRELSATYDGVSIHVVGQQPHRVARDAMCEADLLVAIPGTGIPAAVSGKLFEYLRARRPVLLLSPDGAARQVATSVGLRYVADPFDSASIDATLRSIVDAKRAGTLRTETDGSIVGHYTRREGARQLASILDDVMTTGAQI